MKNKKLWLKGDPAITATVQAEYGGAVCALVNNPHMRDHPEHPEIYLGFLNLTDWSESELVPAPLCSPPKLFVAVVGEENPTDVTYVTYTDELDLRVAIATREDILGWFEMAPPPTLNPVG